MRRTMFWAFGARVTGVALVLSSVTALPAAGGMPGVSRAPAPAASARVAPAPAAPAPSARAAAQAMAAAKAARRPTELLSGRTETRQLFAEPDGTWRMVESAIPVRVRRAGGWVRVDTTLRMRPDGLVVPAATVTGLVLSGGGYGPLVTMIQDGRRLSLGWPGRLPRPGLAGPVATYPDVLPGVDLRVKALVQGFSELLVVKSARAAASPALARLRFAVSAPGLSLRTGRAGDITAADAAGRVVFSAQPPRMWDTPSVRRDPGPPMAASATGAIGAAAAFAAPHGREALLRVIASKGTLSLIPDRSLLTGAGTRYPVYIDPTFTGGMQHWATVYLQQNSGYIDSDDSAKAGYEDFSSPFVTVRSYFQLYTPPVNGTHILSATFSINEIHAPSCSARPVELWETSAIFSGMHWSNQPGFNVHLSTVNTAHGYTGCPAAVVGFSATSAVQQAASSGWPNLTLGLKASNESDDMAWKRFDPSTAKLYISYNSYPYPPSNLATDSTGTCQNGASRPYFGAGVDPVLHTTLGDPDGGNVYGNFTVSPVSGTMAVNDTLVGMANWAGTGHTDVLAREQSTGDLYLYPFNGTNWGARVLLNPGMSGYTFAGVTDWDGDGHPDVIAREDATANLYLFPGNGRRGPLTDGRILIGTGWGGYTFAGLADWNGDGHPDIIAREDSSSILWDYPGQGTRAPSTLARVQIGTGWGGYTSFGVLDWNHDNIPDILAVEQQSGILWDYPEGGSRVEVGNGWWNYRAIAGPDFDGDGNPDIIARAPGNSPLWLYPGNGVAGLGTIPNRVIGAPWYASTAAQSVGTRFDVPVLPAILADGAVYSWQVQANDGTDVGQLGGGCEFGVITTGPALQPDVTSAAYPAGAWGGGVGVPGMVRLGPHGLSDVTGYQYSVSPDNQLSSYAAASPADGTATIRIMPVADGPQTLYVRDVDKAGNPGPTLAYTFNVRTSAAEPIVLGAVKLVSLASASAGSVSVQNECCSAGWVDGQQLLWTGGTTGSTMSIPLTVPSAGWYDIGAMLTLAPGFGVAEYSVDGQELREARDQYGGAAVISKALLGTVQLTAGTHTLTATIVARNAAASGSGIGINYLTLTPSQQVYQSEAESLPATGGASLSVQADCCAVHWSGGKQLSFQPTQAGQSVSLTLNAPVAGVYDISGAFSYSPGSGTFQASLDGTVLGAPYDFAWSQYTGVTERLLGNAALTQGTHTLTFTLVAPLNPVGSSLGIDYLLLAPATTALTFQGEDLAAGGAGSSGVTATAATCACVTFFSGTKELRIGLASPGDSYTVHVSVPAAGGYDLSGVFGEQPDQGEVAISVNGGPAVAALDTYSAWPLAAGADLGQVNLSAGDNTITFTSTGKNAYSTGYAAGVDYLRLAQLPPV